MRKLIVPILTMITLAAAAQTSSESNYLDKKTGEQVLAIKNVNIISMISEDALLQHATVVIKDEKIVSINEDIPDKAKIIDGTGKWLIPGFIDMHVHLVGDANFGETYPTQGATIFFDPQDIMTPYIANGVTTVFELNGRAAHFDQRNKIAKGDVIGPRIALAALINGGEGSGRIANTPSDGRQTVRIAKADGYKFIKVYSGLDIETYKAIIDEAHIQGLKVVGHIPDAFRGKIEQAFVPDFGMVAHAEEFSKQSQDFSDQDAQRFALLAKKNGTWLTPTLITMKQIASQARSLDELRGLPGLQYVHPLIQSKWLTSNNYNRGTNPERVAYFEKMVNFHVKLVKAFKDAGVPIVAGTDAGNTGVIPGFSLPDEIELLVEAGLTPKEALTSATRLSATWLGIGDKMGSVEVGKFADLVLLDANPLDDIKNIRKISGVCVNGRWLSSETIDAMLSDLSKRNTMDKDKYDWKKLFK